MPALVTARGVLTKTPAILACLESIFPAVQLAPGGPRDFARAQASNSYLFNDACGVREQGAGAAL